MKNLTILILLIACCFLFMNQMYLKNEIREFEKISETCRNILIDSNNRILNEGFFHSGYSRHIDKSTQHYQDVLNLRKQLDSLRKVNNHDLIRKKFPSVLNDNYQKAKIERSIENDNLIPTTEVQSSSKNKFLDKLVNTINTSAFISNLNIYVTENPFGKDVYVLRKIVNEFNVFEGDTLRLPVHLTPFTYDGSGIYSLVDTLNFKKHSPERGEFVIPITKEMAKSSPHKMRLRYFLKDEINNETSVVMMESIKLNCISTFGELSLEK